MYEIIGVNGNVIRLEKLTDEEKKQTLSHEIVELLEFFGPVKKQLILRFFSERYTMTTIGCLDYLERLKRVFVYEGFYAADERWFLPETFTLPKVNGVVNTFAQRVSFEKFMKRMEIRQKALAVFLHFREEVGAERWFLGEDIRRPWNLLTFIARDEIFVVIHTEDFQLLYVHDQMQDPRDLKGRLAIVDSDADKEKYESYDVPGVSAFVTVDENYIVTVKRADYNFVKEDEPIDEDDGFENEELGEGCGYWEDESVELEEEIPDDDDDLGEVIDDGGDWEDGPEE